MIPKLNAKKRKNRNVTDGESLDVQHTDDRPRRISAEFVLQSRKEPSWLCEIVSVDLLDFGIQVFYKQCQSFNTISPVALVGFHVGLCYVGIDLEVHHHLKEIERKMVRNGDLEQHWYDEPLPPFRIASRGAREGTMSDSVKKQYALPTTEQTYKKIFQLEINQDHFTRVQELWSRWVRSGGAKKIVGPMASGIDTLQGWPSEAEVIKYQRALRIHMNYQPSVILLSLKDIVSLNYEVEVRMRNGIKPPYKFTNIRRELTNIVYNCFGYSTKDDERFGNQQDPAWKPRQAIHAVIRRLLGTGKGTTDVVVADAPMAKRLVDKIGVSPAHWLYCFLRFERRYAEGTISSILMGCDQRIREDAENCMWDPATWEVTPDGQVSDDIWFKMAESNSEAPVSAWHYMKPLRSPYNV